MEHITSENEYIITSKCENMDEQIFYIVLMLFTEKNNKIQDFHIPRFPFYMKFYCN